MAGVRSLAASKQGVRGCASKRCTIPLAYCSPTNVACAVKPRLVPRSAGSSSAPTTDATVPEGHRGLHSALYDRDAADVHGSVGGYRPVDGEDDGGALLELQAYVAAREGAKPTGVFALYDTARNLQYVGYSRNIVLSIKTLCTRVGADRAAYVRALVVANQAMQTRSALQAQAQAWMDEAGGTPPLNGVDAGLLGDSGSGDAAALDTAAMSAAELAAYEEQKLKMRRAMGEGRDSQDAAPVGDERRLRMIAAVEAGNWSEVIDGQTQATLPLGKAAAVVAAGPVAGSADGAGAPASPFSQATVHRQIGKDQGRADSGAPSARDMTVESVAAVLEEVRPYLQADGGDLEVVGVADGVVALRLEGACSTCASSSATMKMGIERALAAAFGDQLKGVVQVDKVDTSASVTRVDEHLNVVRPAIVGMGGAVEVASVERGVVTLRYRGPPPLAKGLQAAVKDQFPDVSAVEIVPFA